MDTTSTSPDWRPQMDTARHADNTASIHRGIAVLYGVLGFCLLCVFALPGTTHSWGAAAFVTVFFGAIVGLHSALAIGARNRSDAAKAGSIIVGVLMLFAFPIGTIVGGFLIYNAGQTWPAKGTPQAAPAAPDLREA